MRMLVVPSKRFALGHHVSIEIKFDIILFEIRFSLQELSYNIL